MNKTTEALKLAEEWLSFDAPSYVFQTIREALAEQSLGEYHGKLMREVCNKVITKTLAEPVKQEPVAWVNAERNTITWEKIYPNMEPLYAAPVSAPEQEPVAWGCMIDEELVDFVPTEQKDINGNKGNYETALYAAPVSAKREWVDLTDDELKAIALPLVPDEPENDSDDMALKIFHAVIAKFKEKNTPQVVPQVVTEGNASEVRSTDTGEPVAYLVEGSDAGKLIAHQLFFAEADAKKLAAVFATHYPTVHTIQLYTTPPVVPQGEPVSCCDVCGHKLGMTTLPCRECAAAIRGMK